MGFAINVHKTKRILHWGYVFVFWLQTHKPILTIDNDKCKTVMWLIYTESMWSLVYYDDEMSLMVFLCCRMKVKSQLAATKSSMSYWPIDGSNRYQGHTFHSPQKQNTSLIQCNYTLVILQFSVMTVMEGYCWWVWGFHP